MNRRLAIFAVVLGIGFSAQAFAQPLFSVEPPEFQIELNDSVQLIQEQEVAISPAEAADIAEQSLPGYKVIKVKLLPSGVYAVTLKADAEVQRVMVDGETGAIQ